MGTAALLRDHFELRQHFLLIYFYLFFLIEIAKSFLFQFPGYIHNRGYIYVRDWEDNLRD